MDPAVIAIGAGGFITAAIALYRARADKTAVETGTQTGLMEAAVATAKGLAEASAMVVEPLRQELARSRKEHAEELSSARERIAVVEKHAKSCDDSLHALHVEFADLRAAVKAGDETTNEVLVVGKEARDAAVDARKEVIAQQEERERVQERDRKIDEGDG